MHQRAGRTVKQTHLKRLQLCRAPAVLCIHVNRTIWQADGSLIKNSHHMSFPVQLDARALLKRASSSSDSRSVLYMLCAVVEHRGGPNSGHYVTYRRSSGAEVGDGRRRGGSWVCVSDTTVYSANLDEVLGAEAYMLFYHRKKDQKRKELSSS